MENQEMSYPAEHFKDSIKKKTATQSVQWLWWCLKRTFEKTALKVYGALDVPQKAPDT